MGILQRLFRRGGDDQADASSEQTTATAEETSPAESVLAEDEQRNREIIEQELEEQRAERQETAD